MSKVFYLLPVLAFAVFILMAVNFNSNHDLKYHAKKDREITHIAVRQNISRSNF
ncbi:hypothetical protein [Flavobacterium cheongpyeongense]|jgi:hypothetical protein|uniref:hypothetical protein n=1 Tax=Flavobacterium cheongpyeongense TaxID=2212651 RepID=UPI001403C184|nr:hypothetical protein [Flavobacterium cheongpyeongense]